MAGTVFDIQHYAVHDGPGIRTLVFLKGCPLRCRWCSNPESQDPRPQVRYQPHRCTGCGRCILACKNQRLTLKDGRIIRSYASCNECREKPCVTVCPSGALSVCGQVREAGEVIGIVARDAAFYRNSGGGVTFSGGEPMAQPEFLLELLDLCQRTRIHTAVETCGMARQDDFERLLPLTGLWLFDLKLADPLLHRRYTGRSNDFVLQNLAFLSSSGARVIVRVPLIPGITDTEANLENVCEILDHCAIREVDLVLYHGLGTSKYEEFGMQVTYLPEPGITPAPAEEIRAFFLKRGFACDFA